MELLTKSTSSSEAFVHIQKCVDVTPQMAARLIRELRKCKIQFIVAPFEADAQMAWLQRTGRVAAVITEDSDLLLFGCERVLFKMDRDGWAEEIKLERLPEATEIDLSRFSQSKFRHMCMLSGCDYLPSIKGMGLKTAYKYVAKYPDVERLLSALRAEMGLKMPETYEQDFLKAEMTFAHQRVYDPDSKRVIFLNPLPPTVDVGQVDEWDFLGQLHSEGTFQSICEGHLCPATLEPLETTSAKTILANIENIENIPPPAPVVEAVPEVVIQPDEDLPFQLTLDRNKPKYPNIAAGRVSLKRSYSTNSPSKLPRIQKRSYTSDQSHSQPIPVFQPQSRPSLSKIIKTPSKNFLAKPTVIDRQKSIRDFFRSK